MARDLSTNKFAAQNRKARHDFFIEDTLNNVLSADSANYLEAPFGAEGLAAIEVLARLYGNPGKPGEQDEDSAEVDAWVAEVSKKVKRRSDLIDKSLRAIEHILSERSELRELWQDSDEYDNWRASVDELKARLVA